MHVHTHMHVVTLLYSMPIHCTLQELFSLCTIANHDLQKYCTCVVMRFCGQRVLTRQSHKEEYKTI